MKSQDGTVILDLNEGIFTLTLNKKGNSFDIPFLRAINHALDIVEAHEGATALLAVSSQKLFSGGMNLNWIAHISGTDRMNFVIELIRVFGRLMSFPVPTVAVIDGSAFAGGFMFAMAFDFRVGTHKANFALNEVLINMYLPPGMMAVVKDKISSPKLMRDIALTGRVIKAEEAFKQGIIDILCSSQEALQKAVKLAKDNMKFGANKVNYANLKSELNKNAIEMCLNRQLNPGPVRYFRGDFFADKTKL